MAAKGYYRNPAERSCFRMCSSCFRCSARFDYTDTPCGGCSGRPDGDGTRDPHPDDFCQCKQGVMRWVTKKGQLIMRRFESNPFDMGSVNTDAGSKADEEEWNAFIAEKREQFQDPHWDPITTYMNEHRIKNIEKRFGS